MKELNFHDKFSIESPFSSTGNTVFRKNGVTKAANRFQISRNAIYEWKAKYDGNWKSLLDRSHRPHHHPAEHTQEEYDPIMLKMTPFNVSKPFNYP